MPDSTNRPTLQQEWVFIFGVVLGIGCGFLGLFRNFVPIDPKPSGVGGSGRGLTRIHQSSTVR